MKIFEKMSLITTNNLSAILKGGVASLLRPKSFSFIAYRHSKNFIIINTIVITMMGGWMAGLLRSISKTYIPLMLKPLILLFLWPALLWARLQSLCQSAGSKILKSILCWSFFSHSLGVTQRSIPLVPYLTSITGLHLGRGLNGVRD